MARPSDAAIAEAARTIREATNGHPLVGAAVTVLECAAQLPELFGTAAAANVLGTTPANMQRWRSLPAPLYDLPAGKFYDADAIRELAAQRREGATA